MADNILQLTPTLWIVCTKNSEFMINESMYAELLYEKNKTSTNVPCFCIMFIKNLANANPSFDNHLVKSVDEFYMVSNTSYNIGEYLMELKITIPPKDIKTVKDIKYTSTLIKSNKFHEALFNKYKEIVLNDPLFSEEHIFP